MDFAILFIAVVLLFIKVISLEKGKGAVNSTNIENLFENDKINERRLDQINKNILIHNDKILEVARLINVVNEDQLANKLKTAECYRADVKTLSYVLSLLEQSNMVRLPPEWKRDEFILEIYLLLNPDAKNYLTISPEEQKPQH